MKLILYILLLLNLTTFAQRKFDADGSIRHFYAGAGITMLTADVLQHYYPDRIGRNCLIGLGSGVLAGVGKEFLWDKAMGKGVFSYPDFFTTCWGSLCGSVTIRCIIDWREVKLIPRKKGNRYAIKKDIYN